MRDTKVRVCAVCARVLDNFEPKDGGATRWLHTYNPDGHIAVPVELGEIHVEGRCDFCGDLHPPFELPVRDFEYGDGTPLEDHGSRGHWAACGPCALLLERRDWEAVIKRAVEADERRTGHPMEVGVRRELRRLYRLVQRNQLGPVRPLTWPPVHERGVNE